jgi:hypothetical protein
MNVLVRHGCLGLAAGGLLLAVAGCAQAHRQSPTSPSSISTLSLDRPTTIPTTPPPAAIPPELLVTSAPTTQVFVEPILPASATESAPQPATAPAPILIAQAPPASAPAVLPETRPTEPPPALPPLPAAPASAPAAPATPQAAIDAGLHRMLDGQPAFSPGLVAGLSPSDQQFVQWILVGIEAFHSHVGTDPAAGIAALVNLADNLRPAASLQIPTITLCTRVDGFGVYDTVTPQQLPALGASGVVVYCEAQGFSSRQQEFNWETRLAQQISLIDAQGQTIWRDEPNTVVDLCRKQRRDFYIARIIRLPENLAEGKYSLQVSIEDQLSGHKAQAELTLQMPAK